MRPARAARTVRAMALLSGLMRQAAITGRTDTLNAWWADRQGGRWAERTVRAAFQPPRPAADPTEALRDLTELQARGVITEDEFERLRARLGV